jgi:hypothetical protein
VRRRAPAAPVRRLLIRVTAVLLALAIGIGGWQAFRRHRVTPLSLDGRSVAQAAQLLAGTESRLRDAVRQRHGVEAANSRCYFQRAADSISSPVAITATVLCGPVLFAGGDAGLPYATFDLTSKVVGSEIRFATPTMPAADADWPTQVAAPPGLVRPDGRSPVDATLTVPPPPPAGTDLLATAAQVDPVPAAATAQLIGATSGVLVTQHGFVETFGSGTTTRSAPTGRRLLAFSLQSLPGEYADKPPQLSLDVDGVVRGPLVRTNDYIVAAVPFLTSQIQLLLTDSGSTQRLDLVTGRPARTNPALSARRDRMQTLTTSRPITVKVTAGGKSGLVGGTIVFRSVWLSYWGADGSTPSAPDRAFLHVTATVKLVGDSQAYGAEAALVSASLTGSAGSAVARAHNDARDPATQIDDVIEVPADTTRGTLHYAGRSTTAAGSVQVLTPIAVPFDIPA